MKHQKLLLKSFVLLALLLVCTATTKALASEVIGNLSSDGNNAGSTNTQTTGGHSSNQGASGTPDNGSIAGSVSGTSTASGGNGSGGNNNDGNVNKNILGASTANTNTAAPAESSPNTLSPVSSKTAPKKAQAVNSGTGVSEDKFVPLFDDTSAPYEAYGGPAQAVTAFGAFGQFTAGNWFWIIALALLLVAVITYIYNEDKKQAQSTRLHY